jgi:hypothetical protein
MKKKQYKKRKLFTFLKKVWKKEIKIRKKMFIIKEKKV